MVSQDTKEKPPEEPIICFCTGLSETQIEAAVRSGATSPRLLSRRTGATSGCGTCEDQVRRILQKIKAAPDRQPSLFSSLMAAGLFLQIAQTLFSVGILSLLSACLFIPAKPIGALNAREVRTLVGAAAEEGFVIGAITYCHKSRDTFCRLRLEAHVPPAVITAGLAASHQAPVEDSLDYVEETQDTCAERTRLITSSFTLAELQRTELCSTGCVADPVALPQIAVLAGSLGARACDIESTGKIFSFYQYNL